MSLEVVVQRVVVPEVTAQGAMRTMLLVWRIGSSAMRWRRVRWRLSLLLR